MKAEFYDFGLSMFSDRYGRFFDRSIRASFHVCLDKNNRKETVMDTDNGTQEQTAEQATASEEAVKAWQAEVEKPAEPIRVNTSELDFDSIEETFTKIADPSKAIVPEIATEDTEVKTTFARDDGEFEETVNVAHPGDAIITGAKGERYVLTAENFANMYVPLTDENGEVVEGKYLPRNVVKRIKNPTGQEIVIDAPWGGDQNGEADCWLVESQVNGDRYIIEAAAFAESYRPTEEE
jgi:hypothetical protein